MENKDYQRAIMIESLKRTEKNREINVTAEEVFKKLKRIVDVDINIGGGEDEDFEEPVTGNDIFDVPNYKGRVQAVKACRKAANDLLDYIKNNYKIELSIKKGKPLPEWIYKQNGIMEAINKTRFEAVYIYIIQHTPAMKEQIKICEKLNLPNYKTRIKSGKKQGKKVEWNYVLFRPDYQDMTNTLHIQKITLQKYIQRFCELGIMKKLKKEGSIGNFIYAVGYYSVFKKDDKVLEKRNLFLTKSPKIIKGLRTFRIS